MKWVFIPDWWASSVIPEIVYWEEVKEIASGSRWTSSWIFSNANSWPVTVGHLTLHPARSRFSPSILSHLPHPFTFKGIFGCPLVGKSKWVVYQISRVLRLQYHTETLMVFKTTWNNILCQFFVLLWVKCLLKADLGKKLAIILWYF